MERETGRPALCEGREAAEIACYDLLDRLGICYDRVDHAPAETMEKCAAIEAVLGAPICKNLFLTNRQKTCFYLLLLPGDKPFQTKELSAQLGVARLSFAGPEELLSKLGVTPGSVSVLALANDKDNAVTLLLDRDILAGEWIGFHPCKNTSTVRFSTRDLTQTLLGALKKTPVKVKL